MTLFGILKIIIAEACILTGGCNLEPPTQPINTDCKQVSTRKPRVSRTHVKGTKKAPRKTTPTQ